MDFIEDFMAFTEGRPTPEIYRKWAAITTLSGALERRIWTVTIGGKQYANLYTMLVGGPGTGKSQAINPAAGLIKATKKFKIAPNSVTKASFIDALNTAGQLRLLPDKVTSLQYHHLFVFAAELGVFLNVYDGDFISVMNELFDNTDCYREERRHSLKDPISIINPQSTMLLGAQPGFLGTMLPEVAWSCGWTARMLMVYADKSPKVSLFGTHKDVSHIEKKLVKKLTECHEYYGEIKWDIKAIRELEQWLDCDCPPVPDHPKLSHYIPRRGNVFIVKLAMISAMARGEELAVRLQDVERAREWLLEIEALMPQIFRDMVMRSDDQVIEETFQFAFSVYLKTRKPLPGATILRFLAQRTPAEKAEKIMTLMEKAGILERQAGTETYIPRAREMHGLA